MAGSKISSGIGKAGRIPGSKLVSLTGKTSRSGGIGGGGKAVTNSAAATAAVAKSGMGVMSNGPAAAKSGMGIKGASRTIMDAYKTGGTKAAGKAMREYAGRTPKKPFGTL